MGGGWGGGRSVREVTRRGAGMMEVCERDDQTGGDGIGPS